MTPLEELGRDYTLDLRGRPIMFQIDTPTPAILKSKTPHDERHGDESVPALSLGWRMRVPNTWLDALSEGLTGLFYEYADPVQKELDGVPVVSLTKLRNTAIGVLCVTNAYEECTLTIEVNGSTMTLCGCKVDRFSITEMLEGGSVEITFRVGTNDIDARSAGKLVMMTVGSTHAITLAIPTQAEVALKNQQEIVMSVPAPPLADAFDRAAAKTVARQAAADKRAALKLARQQQKATAVRDRKVGEALYREFEKAANSGAPIPVLQANKYGTITSDEKPLTYPSAEEVAAAKPKKNTRTIAQKIARAERAKEKRSAT